MVKHVVVASVLHTTSIEPLDEGGSVSGRSTKSTVWTVLVEGSGPIHVIHLWTFAGDHHVRVPSLTGYIDASISGRLGTATSVHRHGSVRCWCPSLDWAVALMKVLAKRRPEHGGSCHSENRVHAEHSHRVQSSVADMESAEFRVDAGCERRYCDAQGPAARR